MGLSAVLTGRPETSAKLGNICAEARGDVKKPGIYCFSSKPTIRELLLKAEVSGWLIGSELDAALDSGNGVEVSVDGGRMRISQFEISAFQKITLGIPISLGRESREGLMAVPGIGPRLADSIIEERNRRGGAITARDLGAVKGIGPNLLGNIKLYFTE